MQRKRNEGDAPRGAGLKYVRESDLKYYKGLADRCGEIQEIMGGMPRRVTRWGIAVMVSVTVGILLIGWLVKVPDSATVALRKPAAVSVLSIDAPENGILRQVNVSNGGQVAAGDTLALLETASETVPVVAERDGSIGFPAPRLDGVSVKKGEVLFRIRLDVTEKAAPYYGYLPSGQANDVMPGTPVSIGESGEGKVISVSPVADENGNRYIEVESVGNGSDLPESVEAKINISDERLISLLVKSILRR